MQSPNRRITAQKAAIGLFRRCRSTLKLSVQEAVSGPLNGVVNAHNLRLIERGDKDVPPRAWQAFADCLTKEGHNELAEHVARLYLHGAEPTPR